MQDSVFIKAPAKINLFLKILDKRNDGFHNIRTGINFLNLQDEVSITIDNKNSITYNGSFKPDTNLFYEDIIVKVLDNIKLKKNVALKINIKKNIPWQAGLGSASSDAAALIRGLIELNLIEEVDNNLLLKIGSDVPACFYGKNCLATSLGERIHKNIIFPKYYFLLVKPNFQFSTEFMYKKIRRYKNLYVKKKINTENLNFILDTDIGNDFEKIAIKENIKILELLNYLSGLEKNIFARMSGSGSCCYAVFNKKEYAKKSINNVKQQFTNYWSCLAENNFY